MKLTNNRQEKVEKVIWILGHYMVFAAAVSIAYGYYGKFNDVMIAACVFMWADFVLYLLELAMHLGLANTSI